MEDWNEEFLSYEVERELSKHKSNQPETNDGCGCSSPLITLIVGIIVWRLMLEIISICA